jgi:hypothetical protein
MKFALWLEKKDIELYESILNEMDRRGFLKTAGLGLAGLTGLTNSTAAGSEAGKQEINKKPMTASLQDDSPNGMFSITIENAKSKKTHDIQFLIKKQIEKFLNNRQLKLKDPYVNIDVYSYLTNKTKDDYHEKFTNMKDLILSNPHGSSSNKLEAFLMNNKDAYDNDSLTFVFKYTDRKPEVTGSGNPFKPDFKR